MTIVLIVRRKVVDNYDVRTNWSSYISGYFFFCYWI